MKVRSKTGSWCATTSWCTTLSRKSAAKTLRGFGPSEMKQIERLASTSKASAFFVFRLLRRHAR